MIRKFSKIFFTGLLTVLPLAITGYFVFWLGVTAESFFGGMIRYILTERYYVAGMGLITGLALVFLLGMLMMNRFVQRLLRWAERIVYKIPVIKLFYGGLRNISDYLSQAKGEGYKTRNVVMIPVGDQGAEIMGYLMNDAEHRLPLALDQEDRVAVYLPMSYQIGGYTVILPRSNLREVDMSAIEALQFIFTAGLGANSKTKYRQENREDTKG